jgi:polyribonucleotide nucleotidyltransferase
MFNHHKISLDWGGRELTLESGKVARQADGAVMATYGETKVLATVVSAKEAQARPGLLPADRELPGKDLRRRQDPGRLLQARRPSVRKGNADLASDRPSDPPALPRRLQERHPGRLTVLQHDLENDPDILAMVGASAALTSPACPSWARSAARASATSTANMCSTRWSTRWESALDLVVAGTTDAVLMVESEANELSEDVMLGAVMFGHKGMQPVIDAIIKLAEDRRQGAARLRAEDHSAL